MDDNLNYADFLEYLTRTRGAHGELPGIDLGGRFTLRLQDSDGNPLSHARVRLNDTSGTVLLETYAGSDGVLRLFPHLDDLNGGVEIQVADADGDFSDSGSLYTTALNLSGGRQQQQQASVGDSQTLVIPDTHGSLPEALDLMWVVDTTGSMSDELNYITTELREILGTLSEQFPGTEVRIGLVVYRDRGDAYVVRDYPFTGSVDDMQTTLAEQAAAGGGNYPEAMEGA